MGDAKSQSAKRSRNPRSGRWPPASAHPSSLVYGPEDLGNFPPTRSSANPASFLHAGNLSEHVPLRVLDPAQLCGHANLGGHQHPFQVSVVQWSDRSFHGSRPAHPAQASIPTTWRRPTTSVGWAWPSTRWRTWNGSTTASRWRRSIRPSPSMRPQPSSWPCISPRRRSRACRWSSCAAPSRTTC